MLEPRQSNPAVPAVSPPLSTLPLDWDELRAVCGRLDGLLARQAAAMGERYRELQREIAAVRREREAVMGRIFGFVPDLVGAA